MTFLPRALHEEPINSVGRSVQVNDLSTILIHASKFCITSLGIYEYMMALPCGAKVDSMS